ncbi:hypothetical protein NPIL_687901 [Nephila pilipes]|uniref:Uncharacterized protein n=1 Tax=Nephila pilipes TaxID=299642 RepID=A0A8X6QJ91_NEPPI|nr:hypothetical protein NPIL_687901 [Nephila pilipes]
MANYDLDLPNNEHLKRTDSKKYFNFIAKNCIPKLRELVDEESGEPIFLELRFSDLPDVAQENLVPCKKLILHIENRYIRTRYNLKQFFLKENIESIMEEGQLPYLPKTEKGKNKFSRN